jgi:hypothetical protein
MAQKLLAMGDEFRVSCSICPFFLCPEMSVWSNNVAEMIDEQIE